MGQLRGLLRCYAWEGLPPALVLDRCDQLVRGMDLGVMATVVYARLEPPDEHGARRLRLANAGHPDPLLRDPRGQQRWLVAPRSPLVGAVDVERQDIEVLCEPGSLLFFYSDGIVELRDHDPDERLNLLWNIVQDSPSDITVDQLCDDVLAALATPALNDDLALLAVRVEE
jgi:serine phosphatase RsbU (regulator of sigma subunit)